MSEQLNLLDGLRRRDTGTQRVWDHESAEWRELAWNSLLLLAETGEPFTSEDVRKLAGDPPHHGNSVGSLFLKASRRGLIHQTGRTRQARRPGMHATVLPEWSGR